MHVANSRPNTKRNFNIINTLKAEIKMESSKILIENQRKQKKEDKKETKNKQINKSSKKKTVSTSQILLRLYQ